jgi:hypothetical protein
VAKESQNGIELQKTKTSMHTGSDGVGTAGWIDFSRSYETWQIPVSNNPDVLFVDLMEIVLIFSALNEFSVSIFIFVHHHRISVFQCERMQCMRG